MLRLFVSGVCCVYVSLIRRTPDRNTYGDGYVNVISIISLINMINEKENAIGRFPHEWDTQKDC